MAVVLGTNSGFVTVAPTTNPGGSLSTIDGNATATKDVSQANAVRITEIGWYDGSAGTQEANFEVGLYAADGAVVPGEAGTRLYVDATNAKGTSGGWHVVTGLDWAISVSTNYWLCVQLDDTTTTTFLNYAVSGGSGMDIKTGQTTLTDPFGGGALFGASAMAAIYALVEVTASGPTNLKSYNTNVKSNIKSIDTNTIANVKSLDTNA